MADEIATTKTSSSPGGVILQRDGSSVRSLDVLHDSKKVEIIFEDLSVSVPVKGPSKRTAAEQRKVILKGVTGKVQPSRLMAMMGSSGAGKTTLLDVLAGNTQAGVKVEGQLNVNGAPRRLREFRQTSCYVLQSDVLLSSATVRESIATSALLKLPSTVSKEDKLKRVEDIVRELGLVSCANTLIGDEVLGIKGISGGQKRRVSIGVELVKDPAAIFLDEPTSGLDSEVAVHLVELLGKMCAKGRTVALTIHQPNSLITSQFVDFLLLADGKLAYGGPWEDAVAFFNRAGLKCPQFMNPSDYFIHVVDDHLDALVDQQEASKKLSVDVEVPTVDSSRSMATGEGEVDKPLKDAPVEPAWYQIYVLMVRNLRTYVRNPVYLISETSQYAFMGLFVGLMYLQLNNSVETGVSDRIASIWYAFVLLPVSPRPTAQPLTHPHALPPSSLPLRFGMAVLSFTPSFSAVVAWDKDRVVLKRESGQAMYNVTSWFLARSLVNIPLQCVQTLMYCVIAYFMVGYTITWANCLVYYCAYALFQISSESIGLMTAACTPTAAYATLALTFVLLILLSFSGFLVSSVPVYFQWVSKISYLTYALSAIVVQIFDNTDFVCETGNGCEQGAVIPGSDLIPPSADNGLSPGINLLILLGITYVRRDPLPRLAHSPTHSLSHSRSFIRQRRVQVFDACVDLRRNVYRIPLILLCDRRASRPRTRHAHG